MAPATASNREDFEPVASIEMMALRVNPNGMLGTDLAWKTLSTMTMAVKQAALKVKTRISANQVFKRGRSQKMRQGSPKLRGGTGSVLLVFDD